MKSIEMRVLQVGDVTIASRWLPFTCPVMCVSPEVASIEPSYWTGEVKNVTGL